MDIFDRKSGERIGQGNSETLDFINNLQKQLKASQEEAKRLRDFKEFVNMMIRRNLNHSCADYETITAINERLLDHIPEVGKKVQG